MHFLCQIFKHFISVSGFGTWAKCNYNIPKPHLSNLYLLVEQTFYECYLTSTSMLFIPGWQEMEKFAHLKL